jgi:hypothetical protein
MTKVTLELDEDTLARVECLARARQTTVEDLLRLRAQDIARLGPIELHNPAHRQILSALDRKSSDYSSPRHETHDREKARAELYVANRRRLLELIDQTKGDMRRQVWDRSRIYER